MADLSPLPVPPATLEYAGRESVAPPAQWLWLACMWMTAIAAGVGVGILVLYAITAGEPLPGWGAGWLSMGGLITFIALIFGGIYASTAARRGFPHPATRLRAALAVVLPLATFVLAFACVVAGVRLMHYHAHRLIVLNEGSTTIDAIELAAPSFNRKIGPLAPGSTVTIRYPKRPAEQLMMTVTVDGQSVPYVVAEQMATNSTWGPRYIKLNGLTGYKNQERFPPP